MFESSTLPFCVTSQPGFEISGSVYLVPGFCSVYKCCAGLQITPLVPLVEEFHLLCTQGYLLNTPFAKIRYRIILPKNIIGRATHLTCTSLIEHVGPSQVQYQLTTDYWTFESCLPIRSFINVSPSFV